MLQHNRTAGYFVYLACNAAAVACSIPFASQAELSRAAVGWLLCAGTLAITLADLWHLAFHVTARGALLFTALALGLSWLAEVAGVRWGFPFGVCYDYDAALQPMLPGAVPLFIPLAWFVLAQGPLTLFRHWSVVDAAGGVSLRRVLAKAAVCSSLLAAYDLTLEPMAMQFGLWKWAWEGSYYGTPYRNFLGWFLVGLTIYASYFWLAPRGARPGVGWPLLEATWSALAVAFLSLVAVALWNRTTAPLATTIACGLAILHAYCGLASWRLLIAPDAAPDRRPPAAATRNV